MDASLNKRISVSHLLSAESLKPFVQQFVVLPRRSFNSSLFFRRGHVRLTCVDTFFERASRSSLVVCGALLRDLLRRLLEVLDCRLRRSTQGPSLTPASKSSLVVSGALLKDLLRRLPRGPRLSSAALS